MPVFAYSAIDARQLPRSGTITADTPALARLTLRQQGLAIASIDPVRAGGAFGRFRARGSDEAVAELWRNLAVLIEVGAPLAAAQPRAAPPRSFTMVKPRTKVV